MILVWLIAIPFLGGLLAWPAGFLHPMLARIVSLAALVIDLAILAPFFGQVSTGELLRQGGWLADVDLPWIPAFAMSFHLGLDGLGALMVAMTLGLGMVAVIVSWHEIKERVGFYQANLMWSLAGTIGVFLALDLFLFFYFWEVMLVPMYFVIAIWGHERRREAAIKFFLFTQGSGLLMLIAILALAFINERVTGALSFDYFTLIRIQPDGPLGLLVLLGFVIAFLVKLPAFPLHSWLPETHTQAPAAGSVVLAGILLKTGAYGLLRFVVPMLAASVSLIGPTASWLGVFSIFYGAVLAFGQSDIKKLVAYSSISHMGFVLVGIFALNATAWQGVVILMIAHGVSTGALFAIVGGLQERLHSRDLNRMGGLWADLPRLSAFGTFFVLAAMGLPGLGNFVGEFLILRGTYAVEPAIAVASAVGLIPAVLYSLIMVQHAFHGPVAEARSTPDFGPRENVTMLALAAAVVWLGVYPQPILDVFASAIPNLSPVAAAPGQLSERPGP